MTITSATLEPTLGNTRGLGTHISYAFRRAAAALATWQEHSRQHRVSAAVRIRA